MSLTINGTDGIDADMFFVKGRAMFEFGENSNGKYVKFYDGTQVCWREISPDDEEVESISTGTFWLITNRYSSSSSIYRTSNGLDLLFPASFIEIPYVFCGTGGTAGFHDAFATVGSRDINNWNFAVRAGLSLSGASSNSFRLGAVGRWY